jgi:hypothetical protein
MCKPILGQDSLLIAPLIRPFPLCGRAITSALAPCSIPHALVKQHDLVNTILLF